MPRRLIALLAFAALAPAVIAGTTPAHAEGEPYAVAQAENPFSNFFRQLFGPPRRHAPPPGQVAPQRQAPAAAPRQRQRQQQQPRASRSQPQRQAQPAAPAKDPDARQVVVFGDFFAGGLRSGLEDAFLETASVAVTGQSNASSGLVRQDHFDWPAAMRDHIEDPDKRMDAAVIMIGGNDRQALRERGTEHPPRGERWRELYIERVDEVIELFHENGVPVYWVGLPPVQSSRLSQDYAFFNDIYRERAFRAGAGFIDIWNSFVDESGNFATHGPDLNGEQRQLRADDGLHFTNAGNRKLAHFVAREIRRDIGSDGELTAALPQGPVGPRPFVPGDEELETGVGQVVTLTGAPAQDVSLAGGPEPTVEAPDDSAYYLTIILGETPEPKPGRSDDFSWPDASEGEG